MAKPSGKENNRIENFIFGISPVWESLQQNRRKHHSLQIKNQPNSERLDKIISLAKSRKISVSFVNNEDLNRLTFNKNHQGVILFCGPLITMDLNSLLEKSKHKKKRTLVALDQIEDPQNMGAIIRTASYFGVDGIITLKRKAAPLSAVVSKASAGAMEKIDIAEVNNLAETINQLKRAGFFVAGATANNSHDFRKIDQPDELVLIMGNEGKGLRQLTEKRCDYLLHIPGKNSSDSLNVSAAAAILLQHLSS